MRDLHSPLHKSITAVAVTTLLSTNLYAASCDALSGVTAKPYDGQLFYRAEGASGWTKMPDTGVSLGNIKTEFIYVVDETIEDYRSGVVILKTGRTRQPGEEQPDPHAKSVRLVRHSQQFDNTPCGIVSDFGKGRVSPTSYDDYHDVGKSTVDDATLDRFHFKYVARRKGCRATNSALGDTLSPYARTNRGQFSFDPDVVDRGTYFQLFVWTHVTTASASSEKIANQRVEIRQYHVVRGTPECIDFKYRVPAVSAFLRINDLEALTDLSPHQRAPEHRWPLSSP